MIDLKKARTDKGITQQELADKIGVVRQTISNIECGFTRPSVEVAKLISAELGIDWTEFFDEE